MDKKNDIFEHKSVTSLLDAMGTGDRGAFSRIVELTYADMHRLASIRLGPHLDPRLCADGVSPTALAHETFEKLLKQRETARNREHFFALATRLMMQILLDHRRRVRAERRGGKIRIRSIDAADDSPAPSDRKRFEDTEFMRHGLLQLHKFDSRKAEVVTLHAICGMSLAQTAELAGISRATAERDWTFARAWLSNWASEQGK